ncbi:MAG: hypothetical protein GF393_12445 [Armatimonadia bacterium]|nr:hypothetical protein [Armatimonadia bacterium]
MPVRPNVIVIACLVAAALSAHADQEQIALQPGATLSLELPELPPTLWSMHTEKEDTPRVTVQLPENYSPDREFPLFVWLNGGAGGNGRSAGRGPAIMETRDFIFVGMPLFQESLDRSTPANGLFITPDEDAETICSAYCAMLTKVYSAVPNIDTANNVLAGFSNGGHSIAAIVERREQWLLQRFAHYFIVEGGLLLERPEPLANRNVLFMYGGKEGRNEELVKAFEAVYERLVESGAKAELFVMPETGHKFPAEFYPQVRDWVGSVTGHEADADETVPGAD